MSEEKLITKIRQIFGRYNHRDDIEQGLKDLGFHIWSEFQDEYLWGINRDKEIPQTIFLWLDWINGKYHILKKIEKGDI